MIKSDTLETAAGAITIQPVRHASLVLGFGTFTVYSDPVGGAALYDGLPRPDLVLLTHEHSDHFDVETLRAIMTPTTRIIGARVAIEQLPADLAARAEIIAHGQTRKVDGLTIAAIPAHNLTPERLKYHPKGNGNGYVLGFGGKSLYISGDTEDTEEMRSLTGIDVAFLPMNLPYTMTGQQAADAARAFRPRVVYPFHYINGEENQVFANELAGEDIEVRLRDWYAAEPQAA
jgi:L-ascorbate metabolism protein UlaG (beta-lactamase superfamily)